jgi:TATA-box binding protein (TBP) (component of TFIID and TFIIIB)
VEKALRAGEVLYSAPGIMARIRVRGKEVSVLRTGRVLVKGASNLKEVRAILEEIAGR